MNAIIPIPQRNVAVRVATMADLPFLDELQKRHSKALGFFPRAQMEGYIANQWVLIAEDAATKQPLGYCASRDRYLKRDELGVIYQLCVAPGAQRSLVGASLIKAVFDRSAYGCRLYCCWCAQDLDANYFWEALGFVPIAFRAGGKGRGARGKGRANEVVGSSCPSLAPDPLPPAPSSRVHIFWQRRIREGDVTTPWWFPSKTDQGAMREDRLVLPIPPGLGWRDEMPVMQSENPGQKSSGETPKPRRSKPKGGLQPPPSRPSAGRQYGPPSAGPIVEETPKVPEKPAEKAARAPRVKPVREKIDPQLIARARELRDRYLERVNESPDALPAPAARYDVSRSLVAPDAPRALPEAA